MAPRSPAVAKTKSTQNRKAKGREPRERRGRGRPTKFSAELGERICARVESTGVRPVVAASEEGISPRTFERWLVDGRAKVSEELAFFAEEVARVGCVSEGTLHRRVLGGDSKGVAFGPAKAALEILSRTNPHYGPKVKRGVQEEMSRMLDAAREVLPDEWFERLVEKLAEIRDEEEPE